VYLGLETQVDEDTLLLSYCLNETSNAHDLEEQAKNLLGAPDYKDALKPYLPTKQTSYSVIPRPVLYDYLANDVKNTYGCWQINREAVRRDVHLEKLYTQTLLPISTLLAEVENYGIAVDWDYVHINRYGTNPELIARGFAEEKGLEQEIQEQEAALWEIAGWHCNPNSWQQVQQLLYDEIGLTIKGKRPPNTDKGTLEKLPPHPAVKIIRRHRSLVKMLGTYVAAIETQSINGRIHTSYKQHRTSTGRLSSTDPNIQNIPRDPRLRRMYRAPEGRLLKEGDYNTAELRMLAALSGDEFLTGVFLDDVRNLHDEVSVAMYGPNWTPDQRIRAKAINFGIPYGREAFSVAEEFDISTSEAQRLIDAWFARAPQAAKFLQTQRSAPQKGRTLITVFGRKRRPGMVSNERLKGLMNEFANFHMQSPISDFTCHSARNMNADLKRDGAHIVNLVHDSNLVECDEDPVIGKRVEECMKHYMESEPEKWINTPIKFKVEIKSGTHWGLLKAAKT
jgi:DNA polymerase-1